MTVDELAQIIRTVDGENKLGAGALAEAILAAAPSASMGRVTVDALRAGVDAGMATGKRLREIGHGHQFSEDYMAMAISQDAVKAALASPPDHGGGEGAARKKVADRCHPSHVTRISMDASSYDEICVKCGATDHIGGWGKLAKPCPRASLPTQESEDGR